MNEQQKYNDFMQGFLNKLKQSQEILQINIELVKNDIEPIKNQ
tara:strand:- start:9350 stop:9478 length:129 start_codon:yes stop_codon:yes gene_type:complete